MKKLVLLFLTPLSFSACINTTTPTKISGIEVTAENNRVDTPVFNEPVVTGSLEGLKTDDTVWYFLSMRDGNLIIEKSEDMPLMKIVYSRKSGQLDVSYGHEGFLFYVIGEKMDQDTLILRCLSNHDEGDTLIIRATGDTEGLVTWKIPNPYTSDDDHETILTVPESRRSGFELDADSTGIGRPGHLSLEAQ